MNPLFRYINADILPKFSIQRDSNPRLLANQARPCLVCKRLYIFFVSLSSSIRSTCPNHLRISLCILMMTLSFKPACKFYDTLHYTYVFFKLIGTWPLQGFEQATFEIYQIKSAIRPPSHQRFWSFIVLENTILAPVGQRKLYTGRRSCSKELQRCSNATTL